jgi:hypothetical protein
MSFLYAFLVPKNRNSRCLLYPVPRPKGMGRQCTRGILLTPKGVNQATHANLVFHVIERHPLLHEDRQRYRNMISLARPEALIDRTARVGTGLSHPVVLPICSITPWRIHVVMVITTERGGAGLPNRIREVEDEDETRKMSVRRSGL